MKTWLRWHQGGIAIAVVYGPFIGFALWRAFCP